MNRPTKEQLRDMARHPIAAAVVLTIDIMMLPLHLIVVIADKVFTKRR